jgi:hypothetical protein
LCKSAVLRSGHGMPFALYAVAAARERILRLLTGAPEGAPLEQFLPDPAGVAEDER